MGFLDRFRKPKPQPVNELPRLCYQVAYFILPRYVYNQPEKIVELCRETPNAAGPFFYLMATTMLEIEEVIEDAKSFQWHSGSFADGRDYFVLEYPVPPPVDFSNVSPEELVRGGDRPVLAPYFSAMLRDAAGQVVGYFILGQAPIGGGTTLRSVMREGTNCNLGPGPAAELGAFLEAISGQGVR